MAVLGRHNWERHEAKRPEIRGREAGVGATLLVVRTADGADHYYAAGHGAGKIENAYLHVLVRRFETDIEGEYTVVTAWFTRLVVEGDTIYG